LKVDSDERQRDFPFAICRLSFVIEGAPPDSMTNDNWQLENRKCKCICSTAFRGAIFAPLRNRRFSQ
jgi:hypothetical protein